MSSRRHVGRAFWLGAGSFLVLAIVLAVAVSDDASMVVILTTAALVFCPLAGMALQAVADVIRYRKLRQLYIDMCFFSIAALLIASTWLIPAAFRDSHKWANAPLFIGLVFGYAYFKFFRSSFRLFIMKSHHSEPTAPAPNRR